MNVNGSSGLEIYKTKIVRDGFAETELIVSGGILKHIPNPKAKIIFHQGELTKLEPLLVDAFDIKMPSGKTVLLKELLLEGLNVPDLVSKSERRWMNTFDFEGMSLMIDLSKCDTVYKLILCLAEE